MNECIKLLMNGLYYIISSYTLFPHIHTHTHTFIYVCVYAYIYVCVCNFGRKEAEFYFYSLLADYQRLYINSCWIWHILINWVLFSFSRIVASSQWQLWFNFFLQKMFDCVNFLFFLLCRYMWHIAQSFSVKQHWSGLYALCS